MEDPGRMPGILPIPRSVEIEEGVWSGAGGAPVALYGGEELSLSFFLSMAGFSAPVRRMPPEPDGGMRLRVGDPAPRGPALPVEYGGEEAYALRVGARSIEIAARGAEGLVNGVKALARLALAGDFRCMTVQDAPDAAFRAVHMCVFNPDEGTPNEDTSPEAVRRRLVVTALAGYNHAFLEFWGMFPYERNPFARWPKAWPIETVRELVRFARDDLHVRLCPAQNLTSHAAWSRLISRKHVVLDQHHEMTHLFVQSGWCFATERPETKAFLSDVVDELIDAFDNPPYVHIGSDKCFGFGTNEEDRVKPADMLFVNHLCFLNGLIAKRGARTVMWGDMLYSSIDVLYWKCAPSAAGMLPKNILINIWTHNDPGNYWADIGFFEDLGFQTAYSPFLDERGAASMVRLCKAHGSLGVIQTTWHVPETALPTLVFTGALLWNGRGRPEAQRDECLARYLKA